MTEGINFLLVLIIFYSLYLVFMISNFSDDLGFVWFMFFKRIVFENIKNTILVFYKKDFCYLNLVFYLFFVLFL